MRISLLKCHVDKRAICHFKKLSKLLRLLVFKKKLTASAAWSKILKFYKGTENVTHHHHSLEDLLSSPALKLKVHYFFCISLHNGWQGF